MTPDHDRPRRVWVTRTRPGAEATAERVRAAGFAPFIAPLLEVKFRDSGPVDLTGVTALAFTSTNGVRAFAATTLARDLPVFAVGRGTAVMARALGFATVHASDSDVIGLAAAIAAAVGDGVVLNPGPAEPAANLVDSLDALGVRARGVVVYQTRRAALSDADREAAAASDFVLLQSAKAARIFGFLKFKRPVPICLSSAVAGSAGRKSVVAAAPSEDALISALIEAAS